MQRFPKRTLEALRAAKILGIRAGMEPHRFLGIWVVVVNDRVFVRPWNDKPNGWYRTILKYRRGTIRIAEREIPVRARTTTNEGLMDAVDAAYGDKYPTAASRKWVRGFATPKRRKTTTELLPR